eukprot:m.91611 g.91611  ORF g.91611 m.91611 type:complete len:52 (-) comp8876_c0_seq3:4894-5049(-)
MRNKQERGREREGACFRTTINYYQPFMRDEGVRSLIGRRQQKKKIGVVAPT